MRTLRFPKPFEHAHPPVRNVNDIEVERLEAHNDFEINCKAEAEIRAILDHLSAQDEALAKIVEVLAARTNGAE